MDFVEQAPRVVLWRWLVRPSATGLGPQPLEPEQIVVDDVFAARIVQIVSAEHAA